MHQLGLFLRLRGHVFLFLCRFWAARRPVLPIRFIYLFLFILVLILVLCPALSLCAVILPFLGVLSLLLSAASSEAFLFLLIGTFSVGVELELHLDLVANLLKLNDAALRDTAIGGLEVYHLDKYRALEVLAAVGCVAVHRTEIALPDSERRASRISMIGGSV